MDNRHYREMNKLGEERRGEEKGLGRRGVACVHLGQSQVLKASPP